jgi:tetratricopeptide (TPR) repeat protein
MNRAVIIFFLLITQVAVSQYRYSSRCFDAHKMISSLRFEEALQLLEEERAVDPENLVPAMLEGYMDFLILVVGENQQDYDSLRELRSARVDILRNGDPESPWYRYSIAMINLQWAFARVSFGSYINAARDIRRAYLLLEQNNSLFPDFLPDKVGLGIMHALIGTIPDNLQWVARLFNMEGSVEGGRQELFEVMARADEEGYPFLADEALFFLSFIDINLQADKDIALELIFHYGDDADSNLMLVFSLAKLYMRTGHTDKAIDLLVNRPGGEKYYPFYYLDYLTGLAKLSRLDDDASHYFLRFTANFKGKSFIKSAYQKLAWSSLLEEDTNTYYAYMEKVKIYGNDISDGDKLAMKNANSGQVPNVCLLKSRLLFDGGYYDQAILALQDAYCRLKTRQDSIESIYRRGRIFHEQGRISDALFTYDKAIVQGKEEPYYYAANAALQCGMIHETKGDLDRAEEYYQMCMDMKNEEYRNSIKQKAKAGLSRIKSIRSEEGSD